MNFDLFFNCIKIVADLCLLGSKLILFRKMKRKKTVSGISLKWNVLMLIGYVCLFVDAREWKLVSLWSIYNNIVKVALLEYQVGIILLIWFKFYETYDRKSDRFPIVILIVLSLILSLAISSRRNRIELFIGVSIPEYNYIFNILKNTGIFINSLAIIPQLVMIQDTEDCESMTGRIVFLYSMGIMLSFLYDLYLFNSVILIIVGFISMCLIIDFMWSYYKHMMCNLERRMTVNARVIGTRIENVKQILNRKVSKE